MAHQRSRDARRGDARPDAGQSTVEFALVLPLFFGLLVLLFQVGLVARDEIVVTHAARAAVREASVTGDARRIASAGTRALPGAQVRVVRRGPVGQPVEVEVTYVSRTDLPLIGPLLPDLTLHARAEMQVER
jgi:Flp pilus assembly protein TadG